MTDAREQARGARSRRRAVSAVVANYIHEISTRHDAEPAPRRRIKAPGVGGVAGPIAATDSVGRA